MNEKLEENLYNPESKMTLEEKIANIPEGEWWRTSGQDSFVKKAKQLIEKGFTEVEAVEFLDSCYGIVAEEFGS